MQSGHPFQTPISYLEVDLSNAFRISITAETLTLKAIVGTRNGLKRVMASIPNVLVSRQRATL